VLEIGAVASTLGQSARFLATRGARVVVAADSDLQAIQEAQAKLAGPNLRFRPPVFDDFEGGSFDLVMVADLAPYVRAPELLKDLSRLVAKSGYLMGGLRNPAGLALSTVLDPEDADPQPTYGQLLDALSVHFRSVEVATQSPVLGYQLAFERGDGLQVDGSLAGTSEAAYFIVVAGQEPARTFDPTWVQLPPEPLAFTGGKLEDFSTRARDWRERSERLKEALQKKTVELETKVADFKELSAQLEASKDAVARLTAQLEVQRDRPDVLRDREELAQRVRRLEAEITVARERAIDAEGRATVARNEHDAMVRAQKDATISALAAQEHIRLERARREEVATQLEDARTRLARAYEDLKRAQDDVGNERVERERALAAADLIRDELSAKQTELSASQQRELALAEARTQSLLAIEGLERSLAEVRQQLASIREASSAREADRLSLTRSLDVEVEAKRNIEKELQRTKALAQQMEVELAQKRVALNGLETELQASASAHARALRDIETLASSERTWRDLASQYEQRLAETSLNVQQLSDQIAQLSAEKDAEFARSRRLERDLETAITAERTSREQGDVIVQELRSEFEQLLDERNRLTSSQDELERALNELRAVREFDRTRLFEAEEANQRLAEALTRADSELSLLRSSLAAALETSESQRLEASVLLAQREDALAEERATTRAVQQQVVSLDSEVSRLGQLLRLSQRTLDETQSMLETDRKALEAESQRLLEALQRGAQLESTLLRATETLERSTAALVAVRSERDELARELTDASQRTLGLSAQVQSLQRVALATDEALATSRTQRLAIERDLVELRESAEEARSEAERRYSSLQEVASLSAARATELEERVATLTRALREEREKAEVTSLESSGRIESLLEAERALQAREASLRADFEQSRTHFETQLTTASRTIAEKEASIAASQAQVAEHSQTIERLRKVASDLQLELDLQSAARQEAEERRASFDTTSRELSTQLADLQGVLAQAHHTIAARDQALMQAQTSLSEEAQAFAQRQAASEAEQRRLTSELERALTARAEQSQTLEQREAAWEAERRRLNSELEQVLTARAEQSQTLEQREAAWEAERRRLEVELEQALTSSRESTQLVERREVDWNTERQRLGEAIEQAQIALASEAGAKASLARSAEQLRSDLDGATRSLDDLRHQHTSLEEKRVGLERRIEVLTQEFEVSLESERAKTQAAVSLLERRNQEWETERATLLKERSLETTVLVENVRRELAEKEAGWETTLGALRRAHQAQLDERAADMERLREELVRTHERALSEQANLWESKERAAQDAFAAQLAARSEAWHSERTDLERSFQQQLASHKDEWEGLRRRLIEEQQSAIAEKSNALEILQVELAQMTNERSATVARMSEFEHALEDSIRSAQEAQAEAERVQRQLVVAHQAHVEQLQQALNESVFKAEGLTKEIASVNAALTSRSGEWEGVRQVLVETHRKEVEQLSATLAERVAEVDALTQKQTELESERMGAVESLAVRAEEWQRERFELTERVAALEVKHETSMTAIRQEHDRALTAKEAEFEARQTELESQLSRVRDEHAAVLEQQAQAHRQSLDERSAESARLLSEREREFTEQLEAAEAKASEREGRLERELEQARNQWQLERTSLNEKFEASEAELSRVFALVEKSQSEARGHQVGKQALQHELERSRAELDQLRSSLAQVGGESRAAAEARNQLETELERLRAVVPKLEADLASLRETVPELSALRERIPVLEQRLLEVSRRAEDAEAANVERSKTAQATEQALVDLRVQLERSTGALAGAESRADSLAAQLTQVGEHNARLTASLTPLVEAKPIQDAELSELRAKVSLLEKRLADAELEVVQGAARSDVESALSARRQAEELLLALRVKYGDLQHELASAQEALQAFQKDSPGLREQLTELSAENELIESERQRLAESVEELEARLREHEDLEERLLTSEAELTQTREALAEANRHLQGIQQLPTPVPSPAVGEVALGDEETTAVHSVPDLAALIKRTAPTIKTQALGRAPPPRSPPVPTEDPEVYELEVADDDAEEIVLLDEETVDIEPSGKRKK
jgi:chromosome segregation ATPase